MLAARLRRADRLDSALIHTTKREVADGILHSEVLRLVRGGRRADGTRTPTASPTRSASCSTCFPVYRSYLPRGVEQLDAAVPEATRCRPDLAAELAAVVRLLRDPATAVAQRFQQTSGMVMAKGVEDSAFYRYTRLGSLTEVGGEPDEFAETVDALPRAPGAPAGRLAGRDDDADDPRHEARRGRPGAHRRAVRAAGEWAEALEALERAAGFGDPTFANLLWQATVGAWPIERDRLQAYAEKASKEAGASTSWTDPDEAFGERLHAAVDARLRRRRGARELIARIASRLAPAGWSNGLSMKLLQLTAPGVPDVYQGSELWERSLVDPDNRRPVDFARRRRAARARSTRARCPTSTRRAPPSCSSSRRRCASAATGPSCSPATRPLTATGPAADHLIAFDRGGAITLATRLPVGLAEHGGWGDTTVDVGSAPVIDVLTEPRVPRRRAARRRPARPLPRRAAIEAGGQP